MARPDDEARCEFWWGLHCESLVPDLVSDRENRKDT